MQTSEEWATHSHVHTKKKNPLQFFSVLLSHFLSLYSEHVLLEKAGA